MEGRPTDWNIRTWADDIARLINAGKPQQALALYNKSNGDERALPNAHSLVSLLKACARVRDVETGLHMHVDIDARGLIEKNLFIGCSVVDMYMKCGLLHKARQLFNRLPFRNVVLWTALISGYADNRQPEKALNSFECMKLEGVVPNAVTFACCLKACSELRALIEGREIHIEIERRSLMEKEHNVGNALIDMYSKCGLIALAEEVFNKLPNQDIVSWNILIAAYADSGFGSKALQCLEKMCQEHIAPDRFTYISSLKACTSIGAVFDGQEMHAEIERCKLFEGDLSIGNALVEMYSCGGFLAKAQEVFDRLLIKDVISWTSLLSGYVEHDQGELAFECFKQMQSAEVPLDAIAFVWTLKACGSMKSITKAQEIHAEIERHGLLIEDELIGSTIVDAYVKCDLLSIAQQVFDNLPIQTLPSWNALIAGYVEDESAEEALRCFREMQLDGVPPDPVTYICILKACGSLGALSVGQDIHAEIERQGLLRTDNVLGNILLDMYSRCGILATAQELCDGLSDRSVVSWTALMRGYAEHGHGEEALQCLERMQTEGLVPNSVTFVCSLKACSGIGAKDKARGIHMEIEKRGLVGTDPVVANTLVDMYARFGTLVTAQLVFDRLPVQDVVAWTALMAGYAQIGESESVFCTYDKMLRQGVVPNAITFIVVLRACSQSGSYGLSQTYFEAMSRRFGIIPGLEHHACIIDLLGRVGHLDEAVARIDEIPVSPNCVVWHSVLSACGKSGHFKCGNQAFEQALCLDVKDAVAYALMSGVCVDGNFKNVVDRVLSHNM